MRTYAEYLNTMTVKTLNTIARDMKLKGYSKLRKAELIAFIEGEILIDWDGAAQVKIIDARPLALVTGGSDSQRSDTYGTNMGPKPAQIAPKRVKVSTPTATPESLRSVATDDLIAAYQGYRSTALKLGNTPSRVKIAVKAREIATILKSRKVNMRTV
jgi:Rho termination factor, N-terminal domain